MIVLGLIQSVGGPMQTHNCMKSKFATLMILPRLQLIRLVHPCLQDSSHTRYNTLSQLVAFTSIIIQSFVGLE